MEKIRTFLNGLATMSDDDWLIFSSKLERIHYAKKAIILMQGKTERYLSFLEKGIVRFNIPGSDHDITFGFAFENTFFSAYDSFVTRSPSQYNIECISDCILYRISYEELKDVYANTSIGEHIGRRVAEELYVKKVKREISLLEHDARERYIGLLTEQPHLIKHIPQKYLASYIGVRPQSLSRIRRAIS